MLHSSTVGHSQQKYNLEQITDINYEIAIIKHKTPDNYGVKQSHEEKHC